MLVIIILYNCNHYILFIFELSDNIACFLHNAFLLPGENIQEVFVQISFLNIVDKWPHTKTRLQPVYCSKFS